MSRGLPLDDADRRPWLERLARELAAAQAESGRAVLACSALRRSYREILRGGRPDVHFVFLRGAKEFIGDRLARRTDHFMPASLLDSQFAALEEPSPEEGVLVADVAGAPELIAAEMAAALEAREVKGEGRGMGQVIGDTLLDDRWKGIPGGVAPFRLAEIGAKGWNVLREDLPLPLAVLKRSAIEHNGRWMRDFLALSGAAIAPHGKTTMSPQLFERQLADGAWAITVATVHQLQVAHAFGHRRIVLANQVVGRQAVRTVLEALKRDPDFDFYCLVDSVAGVELLANAARNAAIGRPLQVLLEGGYIGGRTGARDPETALATARAVKAAEPHLALRGVEGFEGLFAGSAAEMADKVEAFLDFLVGIARDCAAEQLFAPGPVILTAGGSAFYDLVVERFRAAGLGRETMLLTRSGCYLTHDSAMYRRFFAELRKRSPQVEELGEGPRAALEVWAYIQSRPEPGKAILTMGKRDVSPDEPPVALAWFRPGAASARPQPIPEGHVVTGLNDQHCHMTLPASSPLGVGDMVAFGISHPCLTFDKWQLIPLVDDDYDVVDAIRTFF
jgi:D-serine dehydratase